MTDGFDNSPNDLDRTSSNDKTYLYNEENDSWVSLGSTKTYKAVSKNNDGLIYPSLYKKLQQIKEIFSNNPPSDIKLTDDKNYFYYFTSTDNFVRFDIERNCLRIEVNKGNILRRLTRFPCQSNKGIDGPQGPKGRDGASAPIERYRPSFNDGSFDIDVNVPLDDGPISLRGFDVDEQIFEVIIGLDGSVSDPDGSVSDIEVIGNRSDGKLRIKGKINDPNLRFKIRQRGPKGEDGPDGVNYVQVDLQDAPTNGQFTELVGIIRYNPTINAFIFKKTTVNELFNNVISIAPQQNLPSGDYWAAVEVTTESRKAVEYHNFGPNFTAGSLNLPSYTPLSGCYNQERYTAGYIQPNNSTPFTIIGDPLPSYVDCKEPYWFCGNTGDECDALIDVTPGVTRPPFEESTSSESSESSGSSMSSDSSDSSDSSPSSESVSSDSDSSLPSSSDSSPISSDSDSSLSSDSDSSESSISLTESFSSASSESLSSVSESSLSSESLSSESASSESLSSVSESSLSSESLSSESDSSLSSESLSSESDSSLSSESLSSESFSDSSESSESESSESDSSESSGSSSSDSSSSDSSESTSSDSSESSESSSDTSDSSLSTSSDTSVSESSDSSPSSSSSRCPCFGDGEAQYDGADPDNIDPDTDPVSGATCDVNNLADYDNDFIGYSCSYPSDTPMANPNSGTCDITQLADYSAFSSYSCSYPSDTPTAASSATCSTTSLADYSAYTSYSNTCASGTTRGTWSGTVTSSYQSLGISSFDATDIEINWAAISCHPSARFRLRFTTESTSGGDEQMEERSYGNSSSHYSDGINSYCYNTGYGCTNRTYTDIEIQLADADKSGSDYLVKICISSTST